MKVAIIGTGRIGTSLARAWAAKGHAIRLGARDSQGAQELATALGARLGTPAEAAADADVVVLAVPYEALEELIPQLDLDGRVTVDCTNAVDPRGPSPLPQPGPDGSGLAVVTRLAPNTRAVKGLNTLGSGLLGHVADAPGAVMFVAGDDSDAKRTLATLAADLGYAETVDLGGLDAAPLVEAAAAIWIGLAYRQGRGPDFALSLTSPARG